MWAPVLYDEWISKDGRLQFKSFAIITDGPPDDIRKIGHDRCPIFLDKKRIDDWLNPQNKDIDSMYSILRDVESTKYKHQWVI